MRVIDGGVTGILAGATGEPGYGESFALSVECPCALRNVFSMGRLMVCPGWGAPSGGRSMNVVRVCVHLCGVLGVLDCVQLVAMRQVRVMAGFFVLAGFRVLGRFAVMAGGLVEVLRRFMMVMMNFVLVAHGKLLHLR
jgi:hypothetical protein